MTYIQNRGRYAALVQLMDDDPTSSEALFMAASGAMPKRAVRKRRTTRRVKGQLLDKNSAEYDRLCHAASIPLLPFETWTWAEVQLFRNPPKPRRTEYVLKVTFTTTGDMDKLKARTKRMHATSRFVALSEARQFFRNLRRKKGEAKLIEEELATLERLTYAAADYEDARVPGQPPPLLGCVTVRFEGTKRFFHQFALVTWRGEPDAWTPVVLLTRHDGQRTFDLLPPPRVAGRSANASAFLASYYCPALLEAIRAGRAAKEEKAALAGAVRP